MNNWISLEDWLPDICEDVLLVLKNYKNDIFVGYLYCENKFLIQLPECQNDCKNEFENICHCCNVFELKDVSHWMELPEPPKENEE